MLKSNERTRTRDCEVSYLYGERRASTGVRGLRAGDGRRVREDARTVARNRRGSGARRPNHNVRERRRQRPAAPRRAIPRFAFACLTCVGLLSTVRCLLVRC